MAQDRVTLNQILDQRQLGNRDVAEVDERSTRMVFFLVGGRTFAASGASIREILAYSGVAYVPGCPPSMLGVINVRGDIESVISIAKLLGLAEASPGRTTSILLAEAGGIRSGLIVDAIIDVAEIPHSAIKAAPCTTSAALEEIMTGSVTHQDMVATLIEIEPLFQNFARGLV